MQDCVVETHTLIWHAFKPRRLGHAARAVMESVDEGGSRVFVPAIVVSEFLMVAEKGRIDGLDLSAA